MPPKDWTIRLEDMIEAAEKILPYTEGMSDLKAFCSNEMAVDAVIRNVQIIGEAARHIPDEIQTRYGYVEWGRLHHIRSVPVHLDGVSRLLAVWSIVTDRIPTLLPLIRAILERELPEESSPPA